MDAGGVGGRKGEARALKSRVALDQRGGVQKRVHVDHQLLHPVTMVTARSRLPASMQATAVFVTALARSSRSAIVVMNSSIAPSAISGVIGAAMGMALLSPAHTRFLCARSRVESRASGHNYEIGGMQG
jgi:hypothetical protein